MKTFKRTCTTLLALLVIACVVQTARAQVQSNAQSKPAQAESHIVYPVGVTAEPIALETPTGTLYGTLELPKTGARFPVVIFISGSGPTDRNGNSILLPGTNNSIAYLAEELAARGIASVRYDKRGVAQSVKAGTTEDAVRFDMYIDDAVEWGKQLRKDRRFTSITVAGHSEGALVGLVAAERLGADAYISLAGIGRPAAQELVAQLKPGLTPELLASTEAIVASLREGKTVADVPPQLASLFRPSVQPYIISWFKYDPSAEMKKLNAPVLIAQGTADLQVSVENARLLAQAKPGAKLLLVEGMNHVLKDVGTDMQKQKQSYSDPSLPIAPTLVNEVSGFIKTLKKR